MSQNPPASAPPVFDDGFRDAFRDLVLWRRDVRRFRDDPIDPACIIRLLDLATHAPSVGNCQPWRFVLVESEALRETVRASFARANSEALAGYEGEERALYATLKLAGLDRAPVHLAVFADDGTPRGAGLGRKTMPETLRYSVVGAVHTLWLAARAEGLGLGWISILEPALVAKAMAVPETWSLIAYLCIGIPEEEHIDPELVRAGWEARAPAAETILKR